MIQPYTYASSKRRPDGRLTLTTAVPVTTSDVTGASTIYYTPYNGNHVSLFMGWCVGGALNLAQCVYRNANSTFSNQTFAQILDDLDSRITALESP